MYFFKKKSIKFQTTKRFFRHSLFFSIFICLFTINTANTLAQTTQKTEVKTEVKTENPYPTFTQQDREFALKYLKESKTEILENVSSLSEEQLNFRVNEETWTIGEILEHIILAENTILGIVENMIKSPSLGEKEKPRVKDIAILLVITNRSKRFQAPEKLRPKGQWKTKTDLISNFEKTRNQTISFLETTKEDLRSRFSEHPVIGIIDGYQWFLHAPAHGDRHLAQIKEVKSNPSFPK